MLAETQNKKQVHEAIYALKTYIDNHPLESKAVEETIAIVSLHVSRKHLQEAFRQYFHCTIKQYEMKARMQIAAKLLKDGSMTVKMVAIECGYLGKGAPTNFTRAFKEVHGQTPTKWQNELV